MLDILKKYRKSEKEVLQNPELGESEKERDDQPKEVRFRISDEEELMIRKFCRSMGWTKSKLGATALHEYLKSISLITAKAHEDDEKKE